MAHEMLVGLHVIDDASYQTYREAMTPLLAQYGGGFRFDFTVAKTLKPASDHPINRLFAIYFASREQKEAFYAHPDYLAIKAKWFEPAVKGRTVLAAYER